jgi:hypothetical protein
MSPKQSLILILIILGFRLNAQNCGFNPDANGDGYVGISDLNTFLLYFGLPFDSDEVLLPPDVCSHTFTYCEEVFELSASCEVFVFDMQSPCGQAFYFNVDCSGASCGNSGIFTVVITGEPYEGQSIKMVKNEPDGDINLNLVSGGENISLNEILETPVTEIIFIGGQWISN